MVSSRRWPANQLLALVLLSSSRLKEASAFQNRVLVHHSLAIRITTKTPEATTIFRFKSPNNTPNNTFRSSNSNLVVRRDDVPGQWDGDDIRWLQKVRRRLYRSNLAGGSATTAPARTILIVLNFLMFVYQTVNTVNLIRIRNPQYWPRNAISIISDTLLGSTNVRGPLTTDFVHMQYLSQRQPHRFLTAGFLHGDIIHLLLNLDALRRLPSWLESGLSTPLFLTTFLVSIVTGNIGHSMSSGGAYAGRTFCLGASGGICGLYGLMYVALSKMGQARNAMRILKGMLFLLLSGFFWDNVSNAAHVGGFVGGVVMGILCAPHYSKNYSMRRKWSLEADLWPKDYRQNMGFGISPTKNGLIPVSLLWAAGAVVMALEPKFRSIPSCILRGLMNPGSLSYF